MITTPEAKVDCLNRFISSVFNTDSSIPEQELVEQDLTLGNIILSKKLILDKLTSIKTDKSPGPGTILARVSRYCMNVDLNWLTHCMYYLEPVVNKVKFPVNGRKQM